MSKINKESEKVVSEWVYTENDLSRFKKRHGYNFKVKENGSYSWRFWKESHGNLTSGEGYFNEDKGVLDEKNFNEVMELEAAGKKKEIYDLLENFGK